MDKADDISRTDRLRRLSLDGGPALGGWLSVPSVDLLQILAASKLAYVGIDCQHGHSSEADAVRMLLATSAASVPRLVRVSANRAELIGRVADAGADGIIVPTVNSREEAKQIVDAVRFPPNGNRSYGPMAVGMSRDPERLGKAVVVLPMIETRAGLDAVDEILAVPGVDGVYVGPADLGISLGVGHQQFPPSETLEPALARIVQACRNASKIAAVHAGSEHFVARYCERGFSMMTLGIQSSFMHAGVEKVLELAMRDKTGSTGQADVYR